MFKRVDNLVRLKARNTFDQENIFLDCIVQKLSSDIQYKYNFELLVAHIWCSAPKERS